MLVAGGVDFVNPFDEIEKISVQSESGKGLRSTLFAAAVFCSILLNSGRRSDCGKLESENYFRQASISEQKK